MKAFALFLLLTQESGIATKYPGDEGIEKDSPS